MNKGYLLFVLILALITILIAYQFGNLSPDSENAWVEESIEPTPTLPPSFIPEALPETEVVLPLTGAEDQLYLPMLFVAPQAGSAEKGSAARRVNIPYFKEEVRYPETAIFWFGKVNQTDNFADVRLGYTDKDLFINLAIYDRRLWYNPEPSPASLTDGDSVSLYLSSKAGVLYRFDAMLSWWEVRSNFQAVYQYRGGIWQLVDLPFNTTAGWRGHALNNNSGDDRGWVVTFNIPFSSLDLTGPPPSGHVLALGLAIHDKDDAAGTPIPEKNWPETFNSIDPSTWGEIHLGMPSFSAPQLPESGRKRIRHGEDGARVPGAPVGGGTTCGDGLSFWSQWGDTPAPGGEDNSIFNVQNQNDVADWPCFSRYYLTFFLNDIPADQAVLSATLTLHQMGNSGGGSWGMPGPSYLQIFTITEDWDEKNLTWNNAPLAKENVSGAWVNPVVTPPNWPGIPWEWDLSAAVQNAYATGQPLRLAIYSADHQYHSGKYFVSSYTGDWNAQARPSLSVSWGTP